jgi:hypothetical protein
MNKGMLKMDKMKIKIPKPKKPRASLVSFPVTGLPKIKNPLVKNFKIKKKVK